MTCKGPTHAYDVLEELPSSVDEVAVWFANMPADKFDSVCASAVTLYLDDERTENGFVSTRSINKLVVAMRDRYRRIVNESVAHVKNADLNEMQARIIRRLPRSNRNALKQFTARAYGELFGVAHYVVRDIWSGKTWTHLDRRAA